MTGDTQRNFVADLLQQSVILDGKRPFYVFWPPLGDLGAKYDVHLRSLESA